MNLAPRFDVASLWACFQGPKLRPGLEDALRMLGERVLVGG